MTDHGTDEPDPIADAFRSHTRRPRDIVPRKPADDGPPIPTGPAVEYHVDEFGDDGVTRESGTAYITAPYQPKDRNHG